LFERGDCVMNCKNPECNKELTGKKIHYGKLVDIDDYCNKFCRARHHAILYPQYVSDFITKEERMRREEYRDSGLHLKTILDCGGFGNSDESKLALESWGQGDIL
jgi:hypothetical protein